MPSSPSHKPVRRPRESRRFEDRDLNPKSLTSKAPMEHMENRRRMIGTNRGACAVWHAGTWQDTWQAADAARGIPTQLLVAGEPTTFGALNVTAYGSQQMQPSVGVLESACVWQNASRARWIAAATSASSSPVTVLGTSVSAGCGGGAPRGACSVEYSWARLLQDFVDLQLRRAGVPGLRVRVNLYSKNAVAAGYYTHCTGAKVPPGPGVVLLEVATNLWGSADVIRKEATGLVRAVRRVAPEKVIAFAVWPSFQGTIVPTVIRQVAQVEGADVMDFSHILKQLQRGGTNTKAYYRDRVHPSPAGHALFAAVVARFVAKGLISGGRGRCAPHVAIDPAVAVRPTSDVPLEHCFERADSLPIAAQSADSSWRITDEGKKKGLRKLGLLSRKQHVGYCRLSSAIARLSSASLRGL
jgi:hypothetical protein